MSIRINVLLYTDIQHQHQPEQYLFDEVPRPGDVIRHVCNRALVVVTQVTWIKTKDGTYAAEVLVR